MGAVIDKRAFEKICGLHRPRARRTRRSSPAASRTTSSGYFIRPTLVETTDPGYRLLCEEIFGPVVTAYVYDDAKWNETLELVDSTSPYALTGAVFAQDRRAIVEATSALRYAAGNFYINDKPTGAVVGQQPFGGARASGTNDKAGSKLNLVRWVSARTIKENFNPPRDYRYPFMAEQKSVVRRSSNVRSSLVYHVIPRTWSFQPIAAVFRAGLKNGVFTTVAGTRWRTASTVISNSSVVPSREMRRRHRGERDQLLQHRRPRRRRRPAHLLAVLVDRHRHARCRGRELRRQTRRCRTAFRPPAS